MYRRMLAAGGPLAEIAQYEIGGDRGRGPARSAPGGRHLGSLPHALPGRPAAHRGRPVGDRGAEPDGRAGRALAEARDFLHRHPNSERRSEVARLAGDLTRERGDCAGAVALYDQALSSRPATDDADDASFHRAACLARTGDARGSAGLREYLKRFPLGRHAGEAQRLLSGAARPVTPADDRAQAAGLPAAGRAVTMAAAACARRTEIIGRLPDGAVSDGPVDLPPGVEVAGRRRGRGRGRRRRARRWPVARPAPPLPMVSPPAWNCDGRARCVRDPLLDPTLFAALSAARADPDITQRPAIVYPLERSVHPMNLPRITVQWNRASTNQTAFRIRAAAPGRRQFDHRPVRPAHRAHGRTDTGAARGRHLRAAREPVAVRRATERRRRAGHHRDGVRRRCRTSGRDLARRAPSGSHRRRWRAGCITCRSRSAAASSATCSAPARSQGDGAVRGSDADCVRLPRAPAGTAARWRSSASYDGSLTRGLDHQPGPRRSWRRDRHPMSPMASRRR